MKYSIKYSKTPISTDLIVQNPLLLNLKDYTEEIWFRGNSPWFAYFFTELATPSLQNFVEIMDDSGGYQSQIIVSVLTASSSNPYTKSTLTSCTSDPSAPYFPTSLNIRWNHLGAEYDSGVGTTSIFYNGYHIS